MSEPVNSHVGEARLLITLQISHIGSQIRGLGHGAYDSKNTVQGKQLNVFLEELQKKMLLAKKTLNKKWEAFDKDNLLNPANISTVETCLHHAARAFALTLELNQYRGVCVYGPTDPLYVIYIQRLEEIFTKCFTAAWIYGNPEQIMVGLHGLITDFQINGGVDTKTGEEGSGMLTSLNAYLRACFEPNVREPIAYQKFAELVQKLARTVKQHHPKCCAPLADDIRVIIKQGFSHDFTSLPKTTALQKLANIADDLASKRPNQECP